MPQACKETEEDPDTFSCLDLVCDRRQTAGQREGGEREKEKEGVTERRNSEARKGDTKEQNARESRAMKVTENE